MNNPFISLLLVLTLVPFILYVVVKRLKGINSAMITTIVSSVIIFGIIYLFTDGLETHLISALTLIIFLSLLSLYFNNDLYFILEPAIRSIGSALYLLSFRIFQEPVLITLLNSIAGESSKSSALLPEQTKELLQSEDYLSIVDSFEIHMMFWMVVYGILMIFIGLKCSDVKWLIGKLSYTPFIVLLPIISIILIRIIFLLLI